MCGIFLCPSHPSRWFCWHESGVMLTWGLVGDPGRTVRSLSAASKPRIYPTHDAVTPSTQEEGAEHIFLCFFMCFHFCVFFFLFFFVCVFFLFVVCFFLSCFFLVCFLCFFVCVCFFLCVCVCVFFFFFQCFFFFSVFFLFFVCVFFFVCFVFFFLKKLGDKIFCGG